MKAQKQNSAALKEKFNKKKKNNLNNVTKVEVGKPNGNIKQKTKKIEKLNELKPTSPIKNKKKLKDVLQKTKVLDDVKKSKKNEKPSKPSIVNNEVPSTKESKKSKIKEKTVLLEPNMRSSELLLSLNSAKPSKKSNIKSEKSIKHKINVDEQEITKNESKVESKISKKNEENSSDKTSEGKKQKFGKADKVKKVKIGKKKVKSNKTQKPVISLKDAPVFDEANFNSIMNVKNVEKTVNALITLLNKETEQMKNTVFKDYRFILDISMFKIPSAPKRVVKLNLKHSLVGPDDDVLFIVKDLQRGNKIDYEPTIHHYEDLLREQNIEGIKTIMPFNQLKKEYQSYEMKRKLANLYDYFICESSVVGHVFGFLGKTFWSKGRCTFHVVQTQKTNNLKKEIKKALHKTSFKQGAKGDAVSILVGNHTNEIEQVAENILDVVGSLKTLLPGGHPNIRKLSIKVNIKGTSSLPLYINMGKPPKNTPYIIGTKEQKMNKLRNQAEDILQKFTITSDGAIEKISPEEIEARKRKQVESEDTETKPNKKSKKAKKGGMNQNLEGKQNELNDKKKKKKQKKTEQIDQKHPSADKHEDSD